MIRGIGSGGCRTVGEEARPVDWMRTTTCWCTTGGCCEWRSAVWRTGSETMRWEAAATTASEG